VQLPLRFEVEIGRLSPKFPEHLFGEFGGAKLGHSIGGTAAPMPSPISRTQIAGALKVRRNGLRNIVQNADDADHRRGIDADAFGLVIERDIAAGDRRAERGAGFADAVDGRRKLGHDLRLFRVAEVEAVGGRDGRCSGAGDLAAGFGYGVHRAQLGVEITPAAVAVERHGQARVRGPAYRCP
jgi:hypothetical protein